MCKESDATQQWKNILDRDILKGNINIITLYIAIYELLEDAVISKSKDFYTIIEFDEEAKKKYTENVLSLYDKTLCPKALEKRKDILSSLLWFKKNGAIDDNDITIFAKSKTLRNEVVHEMFNYIAEGTTQLVEQLALMYALFSKIEKWWILEIEIPISGDFPDLTENEQQGVMSGNMIVLEIIMDILANDSNIHFKEACERLGVPVR